MTRYDKTHEYKMIDYLIKRGATLIEHFGDRHQKSGDFLMDYHGVKLRCDHKSCHQDLDFMRVQKTWMVKLIKENTSIGTEGVVLKRAVIPIPIITISLFGQRDRWCLVDSSFVKGKPESQQILSSDWSWRVPIIYLKNSPVILLGGSDYLMSVDVLLRMIDKGDINNGY